MNETKISSSVILFEIADGKLVIDPGQAGRAQDGASLLSKILGLEVVQSTKPGLMRTRCAMTTEEYWRRFHELRLNA